MILTFMFKIHVDMVDINNETTLAEDDDTSNGCKDKLGLLYSITDTPPWYLCIFLGFQVTIIDNLFGIGLRSRTLN